MCDCCSIIFLNAGRFFRDASPETAQHINECLQKQSSVLATSRCCPTRRTRKETRWHTQKYFYVKMSTIWVRAAKSFACVRAMLATTSSLVSWQLRQQPETSRELKRSARPC